MDNYIEYFYQKLFEYLESKTVANLNFLLFKGNPEDYTCRFVKNNDIFGKYDNILKGDRIFEKVYKIYKDDEKKSGSTICHTRFGFLVDDMIFNYKDKIIPLLRKEKIEKLIR